jgi:hypothetical protein
MRKLESKISLSMRYLILLLLAQLIHAEDSLGERFAKHYAITFAGLGKLNAVIESAAYQPIPLDPKHSPDFSSLTLKNDAASDGYVVTISYDTAHLLVKVAISGGLAGIRKVYGPFRVDELGVIQ